MAKPLKRVRAKRVVRSDIKIKTKKSAAKRYKVLGSGKVKIPHGLRSHFTGWRSASRQNRLSKAGIMNPANTRLVKRCLPNSF